MVIFNGASDQDLDCMHGDCSPQTYKRKKIYVQDWMGNDCFDDTEARAEMCQTLADAQDGPPTSGHHIVEWENCEELVLTEWGGPYHNETYEDQSDCVRIVDMYVDQYLKCLDGTVIQSGCFTLVDVEYEYIDNFDVKYWHGPGCTQTTVNETFRQVWRCRYARPVGINQKVAIGTYRLISVQVTLFPTVGPTTTPCGTYVNECAASWLMSPITPGLPWNPPTTLTVTRIC